MTAPAFAYVQARLQARHGQRPDETTWRQLRAIKDPGGYLERARATGLRRWIRPFSAETDVHTIERELRRQYARYVREVTDWLPETWQPTVDWMGQLIPLPFLDHLLRGGAPETWMHEDPELAAAARGAPPGPMGAGSGERQQGRQPARIGPQLLEHWIGEWQRRWPGRPPGLDSLTTLVRDGRRALEYGELGDSTPVAHRLEHGLLQTFRRYARQPPAVCAHLGLMALDVARVRGDLANRVLFGAATP